MIFDLAVTRLEREDADLGTVGQSIWKAVAAVDVFYVDEIADATGLLFDHARQDTQWGETTAGEGSLSKQRAFEAACGTHISRRGANGELEWQLRIENSSL